MTKLEQLQQWWERIQYDTPPWAWRQDPYLDGITKEEFDYLRDLDEPPTKEEHEN